jgi:hypothetical protein
MLSVPKANYIISDDNRPIDRKRPLFCGLVLIPADDVANPIYNIHGGSLYKGSGVFGCPGTCEQAI